MAAKKTTAKKTTAAKREPGGPGEPKVELDAEHPLEGAEVISVDAAKVVAVLRDDVDGDRPRRGSGTRSGGRPGMDRPPRRGSGRP